MKKNIECLETLTDEELEQQVEQHAISLQMFIDEQTRRKRNQELNEHRVLNNLPASMKLKAWISENRPLEPMG